MKLAKYPSLAISKVDALFLDQQGAELVQALICQLQGGQGRADDQVFDRVEHVSGKLLSDK